MMPRVSLERWGGPSDDGQRWFEGRSLAIEWLGFMFESSTSEGRPSGLDQ